MGPGILGPAQELRLQNEISPLDKSQCTSHGYGTELPSAKNQLKPRSLI